MSDVNVQEAAQAAGSLGAVLVWAHYVLLPELKRLRESVETNTIEDVKLHRATLEAVRAIGVKLGLTLCALLMVGCTLTPAVRDAVGEWRHAWNAYDAAPVTSETAPARHELGLELEHALQDVERAAQ